MENRIIDTNEKRKEFCIQQLWKEYALLSDRYQLEDLVRKAEDMGFDNLATEMCEMWEIDHQIRFRNQEAKEEAQRAIIVNQQIFSDINKHFSI